MSSLQLYFCLILENCFTCNKCLILVICTRGRGVLICKKCEFPRSSGLFIFYCGLKSSENMFGAIRQRFMVPDYFFEILTVFVWSHPKDVVDGLSEMKGYMARHKWKNVSFDPSRWKNLQFSVNEYGKIWKSQKYYFLHTSNFWKNSLFPAFFIEVLRQKEKSIAPGSVGFFANKNTFPKGR